MKIKLKSQFPHYEAKISRKEYDKMMFLARLAQPFEVQVLADVGFEDNVFYIPKIHLIKQRVSPSTTEFDTASLADFLLNSEHPERIHGWIHCHVNMGTFWSGVDEQNIQSLVETMGWVVSIVFTLDGHMTARLDVKVDVKPALGRTIELPQSILSFDGIRCEVEDVLSDKERQELEKLFEQTVCASRPQFSEHTGIHTYGGLQLFDTPEGNDDVEEDNIDSEEFDDGGEGLTICSTCAHEIRGGAFCRAGRDMFLASRDGCCEAWVPNDDVRKV